jgi:hypothetical protein
MRKLRCVALSVALLAPVALISAQARSAELEGALQYPPPSVGKDAQPPPPAMMVQPLVSPWRIELGVSGSSMPPGTERFFIHPPLRWDGPGAPPPTGSGGDEYRPARLAQ